MTAWVRRRHGSGTEATGDPCHPRPGLGRLAPLLLQLLLIPQESHQVFGLLPDVDSLVTPISIYVLEVSQRLDDGYVLPTLLGHPLGTRFDQIVQQGQRLVDVAPVFPVVIESLPDHSHNLREGHHVEGQVRNLSHKRAGWTPGVVGGGLSDLDLGLSVVVDHVLHLPTEG